MENVIDFFHRRVQISLFASHTQSISENCIQAQKNLTFLPGNFLDGGAKEI